PAARLSVIASASAASCASRRVADSVTASASAAIRCAASAALASACAIAARTRWSVSLSTPSACAARVRTPHRCVKRCSSTRVSSSAGAAAIADGTCGAEGTAASSASIGAVTVASAAGNSPYAARRRANSAKCSSPCCRFRSMASSRSYLVMVILLLLLVGIPECQRLERGEGGEMHFDRRHGRRAWCRALGARLHRGVLPGLHLGALLRWRHRALIPCERAQTLQLGRLRLWRAPEERRVPVR